MIKADHVLQRIQLTLPIAHAFPMVPRCRIPSASCFSPVRPHFCAAASNAFASEDPLPGPITIALLKQLL